MFFQLKKNRFTFDRIVKYGAIIFFICTAIWFLASENLLQRPDKLYITSSGSVDMCLSCHKDEKLDPAHAPSVIGCASCHLGDPLAVTKEAGHKGMVFNPGDLRYVAKTCGVDGCHQNDVHKVKNSLMATNRGIIGTLLYYWGETDTQDTDLTVEELIKSGQTSLALDYFRKLCGTCHLWKQKNDMPGGAEFFNEKGGGCTACHSSFPGKTGMELVLVADQDDEDEDVAEDDGGKKVHPLITKKVQSAHCIRCHNRSGRIGISYMGIFESEGYGTPYEQGLLNSKQLPGARFYLNVADDIHHKKGMECIDCHTRNEIMGDGKSYAHYEDQLEISCEVCHSDSPGTTRKNELLTNVEQKNGETVLVGKVDDKIHPLKTFKKGICDFPAHKRVSCEACHSTWVAQCYGCHAKRDAARTHLDKLSLKETAGLWEEGRSYIRYERPMLGVWKEDIVIVTPGCQDIVTVVDEKGEIEQSFNSLTMAAINPHTTQASGRDCVDCHASTKTVGLGEGRILIKDGVMSFEGINQGVETSAGKTVPLDAYVNLRGESLQKSSRKDLRPFNGTELQAILRVGLCVSCHDSYADPMWKGYKADTLCSRGNVTQNSEENGGLSSAE